MGNERTEVRCTLFSWARLPSCTQSANRREPDWGAARAQPTAYCESIQPLTSSMQPQVLACHSRTEDRSSTVVTRVVTATGWPITTRVVVVLHAEEDVFVWPGSRPPKSQLVTDTCANTEQRILCHAGGHGEAEVSAGQTSERARRITLFSVNNILWLVGESTRVPFKNELPRRRQQRATIHEAIHYWTLRWRVDCVLVAGVNRCCYNPETTTNSRWSFVFGAHRS